MEIFTYPSTTSYTSGDGSVSAMETKVSRPAKREFHPRSQRLACDRLRAAPPGPAGTRRDTPALPPALCGGPTPDGSSTCPRYRNSSHLHRHPGSAALRTEDVCGLPGEPLQPLLRRRSTLFPHDRTRPAGHRQGRAPPGPPAAPRPARPGPSPFPAVAGSRSSALKRAPLNSSSSPQARLAAGGPAAGTPRRFTAMALPPPREGRPGSGRGGGAAPRQEAAAAAAAATASPRPPAAAPLSAAGGGGGARCPGRGELDPGPERELPAGSSGAAPLPPRGAEARLQHARAASPAPARRGTDLSSVRLPGLAAPPASAPAALRLARSPLPRGLPRPPPGGFPGGRGPRSEMPLRWRGRSFARQPWALGRSFLLMVLSLSRISVGTSLPETALGLGLSLS